MMRPNPRSGDDWRRRAALFGRPSDTVAGLDDARNLKRVFVTAFLLWFVGFFSFTTVVSHTEPVTVTMGAVYVLLGPLLGAGAYLAMRTERMPGLLLIGVIAWTSALGAVSDFYYEMTAVTTVALCTAFVSWLGSRFSLLYGLTTVGGLLSAGLFQEDPALTDRMIVVTLAVGFAVAIVGRSSDASRIAQHDREVLMERLSHESRHDELTGVGNRKHLIEQTHIALASDADRVALALVDLDDFKTVNDTHGHAVGDQVLVETARRIMAAVGTGDVVTRVGGDEFAVLFPGGETDPGHLSDRLAAACNYYAVIESATVEVRASVGVVAADRVDVTLKDLLAGADDAMYGRKRTSRANREVHIT